MVKMNSNDNILEIDNLCTYFSVNDKIVKAVDGVSFDIPKKKIVCVVGESGCGKSVTALSIMRLIDLKSSKIVNGQIRFNMNNEPIDILKSQMDLVRSFRGNDITMIFQEPLSALNPVIKIGEQIAEIYCAHYKDVDKKKLRHKVIKTLRLVKIPSPENIYKSYPHELSGGMRQRVMIAMAILCKPKLIIADEPTTALDVTTQAQILALLRDIKEEIDTSIMFITHDLGVVAQMADYVVVMYAGKIVEKGTVKEIFKNTKHPYTKGLLKSINSFSKGKKLYTIKGNVPNLVGMPCECYFKNRCDEYNGKCDNDYPQEVKINSNHFVSCWKYIKDVRSND